MMKKFFKYFFVCLFILIGVFLQSESLPGIRANSMGGAFTAIADDINAVIWNPAGLTGLIYKSLEISGNLIGKTGFYNAYISTAIPLPFGFGFGASVIHSGYTDITKTQNSYNIDLNYIREYIRISGAYKVSNLFDLGITGKAVFMSASVDGISAGFKWMIGGDIGMLFHILRLPNHKINFSAVLYYLYDKNKYETKDYKFISNKYFLPFDFRSGVSYIYNNMLIIGIDFGDDLAIGGEFKIRKSMLEKIRKKHFKNRKMFEVFDDIFSIRVGVSLPMYFNQNFLSSLIGLNIATGFGVKLYFFEFNYGFHFTPVGEFINTFSIRTFLDFKASFIGVDKLRIADIFPVLYKYYGSRTIGSIDIENKSSKTLECEVSFFVDKYMDFPSSTKDIIRAKSKKKIEFSAVFNREILNVSDDRPVNGSIVIKYIMDNKPVIKKISGRFILFGRHAMVWDDPYKITAFATPDDPVIKYLARNSIYPFGKEVKKNKMINENLYFASAVFNTLKAFDITYIKDPNDPFAGSSQEGAVDNVNFPSETLETKSGDCDDLSTLYISLLENIGIKTAYIDIPGHIYMMFDTGMPASKAKFISGNKQDVVIYKGRVWIPVETTMIKSGFYKAWKEGVKEYYKWDSSKRHIINVSEGWKKYPPASYSGDKVKIKREFLNLKVEPIKNEVNTMISKLEKSIMKGTVNELEKLAEKKQNPESYNLTGVILAELGLVDKALKYFNNALKKKNNFFPSLINIGNIYYNKKQFEKAVEYYKQALMIKDDAKVHINLAYTYFEQADMDKARKEYKKAIDKSLFYVNREFESLIDYKR